MEIAKISQMFKITFWVLSHALYTNTSHLNTLAHIIDEINRFIVMVL